jgi:hypothetical protein
MKPACEQGTVCEDVELSEKYFGTWEHPLDVQAEP